MSEHKLNALADKIHQAHIKWWHCPVTGEYVQRNKGELLALILKPCELLGAER